MTLTGDWHGLYSAESSEHSKRASRDAVNVTRGLALPLMICGELVMTVSMALTSSWR